MNTKEASRVLNMTVQGVHKLVEKGILRAWVDTSPKVGSRGRRDLLFNPQEVWVERDYQNFTKTRAMLKDKYKQGWEYADQRTNPSEYNCKIIKLK